MTNVERREIEKKILTAFVDSCLAAGYRLAVSLERGYDIDEMLLGSVESIKIIEAAMAGDDCHVFLQEATGDTVDNGNVVSIGYVYFVWGNDGYDCMSDYTTNLEELGVLTSAQAIANYYGA